MKILGPTARDHPAIALLVFIVRSSREIFGATTRRLPRKWFVFSLADSCSHSPPRRAL
jgi:hypothetical protein